MHGSIGRQLGEMLAQYEEDLSLGGDDVETMQKLALLSETFQNFANSGRTEFVAEFDAGYSEMCTFLMTVSPPNSDSAIKGEHINATAPSNG